MLTLTECDRNTITAALCDFVSYLAELPDPIIIGKDYSREKLLRQFGNWCKKRNIVGLTPEAEFWLALCQRGYMDSNTGGEGYANDPE